MATRVVDLGNVKGPQGAAGPQGPKGDTGPAGPAGADGKRPARFVVGAASAGWTAADCDYLCVGGNNQVEINAAIQALPQRGGEVVLLDGSYSLSGTVQLGKKNVTLRGSGPATELYNYADVGVLVSGADCTIRDLRIDGRYWTALQSTGDYFTLVNAEVEVQSGGDRLLILGGKGARVLGNRFVSGDGGDYGFQLGGSRHVIANNVLCNCTLPSAPAGSAVANNVTVEEE